MDKEANLTIEQMKKIAHEIIDTETNKEKIEINAFPITFIEYYSDYIFREKLKLSILKEAFQYTRNESQGQEHIIKIPNYLEQANNMEKKHSKGYMTISVCYITSFLIIILTIIYLIIK